MQQRIQSSRLPSQSLFATSKMGRNISLSIIYYNNAMVRRIQIRHNFCAHTTTKTMFAWYMYKQKIVQHWPAPYRIHYTLIAIHELNQINISDACTQSDLFIPHAKVLEKSSQHCILEALPHEIVDPPKVKVRICCWKTNPKLEITGKFKALKSWFKEGNKRGPKQQ